MELSTAERWYYKTAFIPLDQLQFFSEEELKQCLHSGPLVAVDKPRWQRSPIWKDAQDVAWQFRQTFYPKKFVPLRPLVIQAFRLFRQGFKAPEILQAMKEAAARGVRQAPRSLWFFIGWVRRLRSWKDRILREAETRERQWQEEKRSYSASRLWGVMANSEGPVSLRHLIGGFAHAWESSPDRQ